MSQEYSSDGYHRKGHHIQRRSASKKSDNYRDGDNNFRERQRLEPNGRISYTITLTATTRYLITIILASFVLLGGNYLYYNIFHTETLPATLLRKPSDSTIQAICEAYKSLARVDNCHIPELYTYLGVPQTSCNGRIVASIKHKTEEDYRELESSSIDERAELEQRIRTYNKIGVVLLIEENRSAYQQKIMRSRGRKENLKRMCKDEWVVDN